MVRVAVGKTKYLTHSPKVFSLGIPFAGNHPSLKANTNIKISPIKNTGIDRPTRVKVWKVLSKTPPLCVADLIPIKTESTNDRIVEPIFKNIVFLRGSDRYSETGLLTLVDYPKSPFKVLPSHLTYCSGKDLSSPYLA